LWTGFKPDGILTKTPPWCVRGRACTGLVQPTLAKAPNKGTFLAWVLVVRDNEGLSRMETLIEVVSIPKAPGQDYPSEPALGSRSGQTQSGAVPVNLPIAQPVATRTVPTSQLKPVPVKPREVFIQGITKQGRTFRPSDWAERLAGAMSSFRPGGAAMGIAAHIGYSPYCVPTSFGDIKCVVVNEALRDLEPMAWDFVMNFARDNDLQVVEACLLPDVPSR
jgi:hypothetical protein